MSKLTKIVGSWHSIALARARVAVKLKWFAGSAVARSGGACVLTSLLNLLISMPATAQSLVLQSNVAVNDKAFREILPYRVAIYEALGESFVKAHWPVIERRRVCSWGGEWRECGFLKLQAASSLSGSQVESVKSILMNPCFYITDQGYSKYFRSLKPIDDSAKLEETQRLRTIKAVCKGNMLMARATRVAVKSNRYQKGLDAIEGVDEIAFESLIGIKK